MPKVNNTMNAMVKMATETDRFLSKVTDPFRAATTAVETFANATISYDNEVNHRPTVQQWAVRTP